MTNNFHLQIHLSGSHHSISQSRSWQKCFLTLRSTWLSHVSIPFRFIFNVIRKKYTFFFHPTKNNIILWCLFFLWSSRTCIRTRRRKKSFRAPTSRERNFEAEKNAEYIFITFSSFLIFLCAVEYLEERKNFRNLKW